MRPPERVCPNPSPFLAAVEATDDAAACDTREMIRNGCFMRTLPKQGSLSPSVCESRSDHAYAQRDRSP